ncbi:MFS transporter [soil metagenome]
MTTAWRVVLSCFVGVSVSIAPAYLTVLGLFIKQMSSDTGFSRTQLSLMPSMMALVAAVCSPFVGGLIDRWGARNVVLLGVVLLPLGLLGHAAFSSSLVLLFALAVLMGMTASFACPLPYVSALPQWFDRNLGLAIALSMTGIGFGEIVLPKLAAYLIASGGWRHAWAVLAGVIMLVGVLNATLLFRENPDFIARRSERRAGMQERDEPGATWQQAIRTPAFWLLGVAVCLIAQVGVGMMVHAVPMLTDRGVAPTYAVNAIAILGLGSLVGRLTTGFLLDRLSMALVGGLLFSLQALGILLLWGDAGLPANLIAMFLVGMAVGAETDIIPFAVRRLFGLRQFGRIFGMIYGIFTLGPVLGPLFMGYSFDRFGSYSPALLFFAASALFAAAAIAIVGNWSLTARGAEVPA